MTTPIRLGWNNSSARREGRVYFIVKTAWDSVAAAATAAKAVLRGERIHKSRSQI
jgi:hypothetical protein